MTYPQFIFNPKKSIENKTILSFIYSIKTIENSVILNTLLNQQSRSFAFILIIKSEKYKITQSQNQSNMNTDITPCHSDQKIMNKFTKKVVPFMAQKISKIVEQKEWKLNINTSQCEQWANFLKKLQETQCQKFSSQYVFGTGRYYCQRNNFSMLTCIAHVSFSNLIRLNLPYNHIKNIEAIAFMDMKELSEIDLTGNLITSFKALQKTNMVLLNMIKIEDNYAQKFDINRTKTSRLVTFTFQQVVSQDKFLDESWVAKMEESHTQFEYQDKFLKIHGTRKAIK